MCAVCAVRLCGGFKAVPVGRYIYIHSGLRLRDTATHIESGGTQTPNPQTPTPCCFHVCDVCAVVFYVIVSHVSLFVSCIYCVIFFCFYVCVCGKEL